MSVIALAAACFCTAWAAVYLGELVYLVATAKKRMQREDDENLRRWELLSSLPGKLEKFRAGVGETAWDVFVASAERARARRSQENAEREAEE